MSRSNYWTIVSASVAGSSHVILDKPCEDSAVCFEKSGNEGSILIAVASDGAGSAELARIGSRIVVRSIANAVSKFINDGGSIRSINEETAMTWIDQTRDAIGHIASKSSRSLRDYAATLVAAIVSDEYFVLIHVGDGACVVAEENSNNYVVPSWPAQGEYASTTFFVTQDPLPPVNLVSLEGRFDRIAVFTDGIESLVLETASQKAHQPFFDKFFSALQGVTAGRSRYLSKNLKTFLQSKAVLDRTDDDKTLLLALRANHHQ
ncbi:MAG: protein phosphatase 2C domain-containing protein [Xanthobacteraceae bacterium]|nr:protein phosphatase 2C domain-containing protein [Xanthobacteraceae bacterium]QYK44357.1 MAG: protein phosphatase 2C domain-containing protein [Xanthobacteraceae bacterium]